MTVPPLDAIRSVYFIGIAGIGMSAVARYFHRRGVHVEGYDRDRSDLAMELEREGIRIHYTIDPDLVPRWPDVVVYTPAVPDGHAELMYLRANSVPIVKRAEMLGIISSAKRCIAVAGTHGKTTTSCIAAYGLRKCGLDCTAFLGGVSVDLNSNYADGGSDWIIVEADEYDRSFLRLSPEIAVVTAMDADHLDIYGSGELMEKSFIEFMDRIEEGGTLILYEPLLAKIGSEQFNNLVKRGIDVVTYGNSGKSTWKLISIEAANENSRITIAKRGEELTFLSRLPGLHNALNTLAALAVAEKTEQVDIQCFTESMAGFRGIRRRFEIVHAGPGLVVIDDYAHHPEELKAIIAAVKQQYTGRRLTGVFQPHLYSRTRDFFRQFAVALDALDECVLVELYPAREEPIESVSETMIYDEMQLEAKYCVTKNELSEKLKELDPELLLFMGAGDLDRMIPGILDELIERKTLK